MSNPTHKLIKYWLPPVLLCTLIFINSSGPSVQTLPKIPHFDKILHFAVYALLGILFFRAFSTLSLNLSSRKLILISIVASGLYGLSDELHQYFVPFREADPLDLAADFIGSVFGVYFFKRIRQDFETTD